MGDPMKARVVGAHTLRLLVMLPVEEQDRWVAGLIGHNRGH